MKKYFKTQLNDAPITKDQVDILFGKSLYTNYQAGDQLFRFLDYKRSGKDINLCLKTVVERDFEMFKKEYKFLEMRNNIPVFYKRI